MVTGEEITRQLMPRWCRKVFADYPLRESHLLHGPQGFTAAAKRGVIVTAWRPPVDSLRLAGMEREQCFH
jgi:hypothetical protein